jgi:hypothetical protein
VPEGRRRDLAHLRARIGEAATSGAAIAARSDVRELGE